MVLLISPSKLKKVKMTSQICFMCFRVNLGFKKKASSISGVTNLFRRADPFSNKKISADPFQKKSP